MDPRFEPLSPLAEAWRLPAVRLLLPFLLGTWAIPGVTASVGWLSIVALGSMAWWVVLPSHRRVSHFLACSCFAGTLALLQGTSAPLSENPEFDGTRPVSVVLSVQGCWLEGEEGWAARGLAMAFDQGRERPVRAPLRVGIARRPDELPRCGGVVRVAGYLRPPREYRNLVRVHVGSDSLWVKSPRLLEVVEPPGFWERRTGRLQDLVAPAGWRDGASAGERLAHALALGDRGALDPQWIETLRLLGLSHLLVVSGLHLGLAASLVVLVGLKRARSTRLALTLLVVALYAFAVGAQPSVLRATVMLVIVILGLGSRRPPQTVNSLAVAVVGLLVLDPTLSKSYGFQLSVAATAGILLLGPGIGRNLSRTFDLLLGGRWPQGPRLGPRVVRGLLSSLAVTIGAQVATLPWTVGLFHWWSPFAPLWNLIAIPWAAVSVAGSLGWLGLRLLLPPLARWLAEPWLGLLVLPVEWVASVDLSRWAGGPCVLDPYLLFLVVGLLGYWATGNPCGWGLVCLPGLAILLLWWGGAADPGPRDDRAAAEVSLTMLDVGQGDAFVLQGGGHAILVDGGGWTRPGIGSRVVLPALAALGVRRLDAAIVSHADRDHCGGVDEVSRILSIERLVVPLGWSRGSGCDLARSRKLEVEALAAGRRLRVGPWELEILGPTGAGRPNRNVSPNSGSLVLRARAAGRCVLLTGDIEQGDEAALRRRWGDQNLRCDTLKVAHHGSKTSTGPGWLFAVQPRLALVSAGRDNGYGHPSGEVVRRLENRRIWTLRTDRHGMVRLRWSGPHGRRVETIAR